MKLKCDAKKKFTIFNLYFQKKNIAFCFLSSPYTLSISSCFILYLKYKRMLHFILQV